MIPRKAIETATQQFKALRAREPSLSAEDAQAILIAASNDAVAQAIYSIDLSNRDESRDSEASRILHELKLSWDAERR